EFHALGGSARGQRMLDVRAVEKRGQIAQQAETPDRSPTHVFEQAVVSGSFRRDHHFAAGEAAVVEGEKKTAAAIVLGGGREAMRKRTAIESCEAGEHAENVAGFAERFEAAIGGGGDVGGETESEEIDVVKLAGGVDEMHYVAASLARGGDGFGSARGAMLS